ARVSTGDLNRVLRHALERQPPVTRHNRRPKIFYATQVATNPPTIVLFTNGPELFDNTYQRYLLKTFHTHLPFREVPIKMYLRHKRTSERPPAESREPAAREREAAPDLSGLEFRTSVSNEELEHDRDRYESELWKDL